jgi:hypothetical protein
MAFLFSRFSKQFPHRKNADGSWDSICSKCFRTVATAKSERILADAEANHVCVPSIFADPKLFQNRKPAQSSADGRQPVGRTARTRWNG